MVWTAELAIHHVLQTAVVGRLLVLMIGRSRAGAPVLARMDPEEVLVDVVGHVVVVRVLEHGRRVEGMMTRAWPPQAVFLVAS